jgi:hypothetical protein
VGAMVKNQPLYSVSMLRITNIIMTYYGHNNGKSHC